MSKDSCIKMSYILLSQCTWYNWIHCLNSSIYSGRWFTSALSRVNCLSEYICLYTPLIGSISNTCNWLCISLLLHFTLLAVGEDFRLVFQMLALCPGTRDNNVQSLVVDIMDDLLVEGTESFVISGVATEPALFVFGRDTATVTILDNDGKCSFISMLIFGMNTNLVSHCFAPPQQSRFNLCRAWLLWMRVILQVHV